MAYRIKGDVLVARDLTASGSVTIPSGSFDAPSLRFISDPDTGIYNSNTNQIAFVTNGTERWKINGAGDLVPSVPNGYAVGASGFPIEFVISARYRGTSGTEALPTYSWTSDTASGMYLTGSSQVAISVSGSDVALFDNTSGVPFIQVPPGTSAGNLGFKFADAIDTGFYSNSNTIWLVANGTQVARASNQGLRLLGDLRIVDGTAGDPGLQFNSDQDTGIFRSEDGSIDFANNGTSYWKISGSGELTTVAGNGGRLRVEIGSETNPGIAWRGDDDTGLYREAVNQVSFVANGAKSVTIGSTFLRPLVDDARDLGVSGFHWRNVWIVSAEGATTSGPSNTGYSLPAVGTNAGAYAIGIDSSLLSNVDSNATDLMTALDQMDASITGVTGSTAAFTDTIAVVDWQVTGSDQVYTISGSTHGLATDNMQIQMYRSSSDGFTLLTPQATTVNSDFDVKFTISSGSAFDGQAILLKSGISSITVVDQFADSGNQLSTTSSLQYGSNVSASNQLTLTTTTTTGSETVAALTYPLSGSRVYDLDFTILAAGTGSGITKRFKRNLVAYDYGSPTIMGGVAYAVVPDISGSSAADPADVDFEISGNDLVCYVSGVVSQSITWTVNAFVTKGEN